ncbi:MAG: alpha/beta hydrolase [Clostridia bacterium]|nr:alpha/beta hydrolase [Clostridia bacterium]
MLIPKNLLIKFWDFDAKMDAERLSKQDFPTDLVEILDVPYVKNGGKLQMLDVYYPKGTKKNKKLPVIIDIHGGGWFYGTKDINKNYCLHLAQRGFVVFNLSYRLVPEVTVKEQLQDVMSALDFISKNLLSKYPCDKNRIYITGDSAGGQLAAFVPALNSSDKMRKAFDTENPNIKIKAVGLTSPCPYLEPHGLMKFYLPHVLGKNWKKEKWAKYVDFNKVLRTSKDYPPTIIFTSLADVIAEGQAKKAYKYMKKQGIKAKYDFALNPTLMHVYAVLDPDAKASVKAIDNMIKFFNKNK